MNILSVELLSAIGAIAGGVGAGGLLRVYIRYRTRLQLERERSARAAARAHGLARIAGRHDSITIDETDADGHRVVRMRRSVEDRSGRNRSARGEAA